MIEWILEKLPILIFVLVFVAQIVRGFMKMKGTREDAPPPARPNVLEEHRRTQEVQEEIRRRIAERRAGRSPVPESTQTEAPPPVVTQPDPTAIPPMPEPLRRMLEQLEKKVQPQPAPMAPAPVTTERRHAELERQQRLADELKAVQDARVVVARRAAHVAEAKAEQSRTEGALRRAARSRLDHDLRDPESLRRAFVLREVLGTPVGLR